MAREFFNFDNIADGSTFTDPVAAGGTSPSFRTAGSPLPVRDNSVKPSDTPGAARMTLSANGTSFVYKDMTTDAGALRFMYNFLGAGMPSVDVSLLWVGIASTRVVSVSYITASQKVRLFDATGATVWTSTVSVPDAIFGLDFYFKRGTTISNGELRVDLLDASGAVIDSSTLLTGRNCGTASFTRWRAGICATANLLSGLMVAKGQSESAATTVIGSIATVTAGTDQVEREPYSTATLTAAALTGSVDTWNWTQTAGTEVDLTGTGATRNFIVPATFGETLTFSVTGTNPGGTSTPDTVNVGLLPHLEWIKRSGVLVPMRAMF